MNNKIKAFIQKHERAIKVTTIFVTLSGIAIAIVANKDKISESLEDDSLTEDEWEHLIDMARQMDEYVAERKALKSK